MNGKKFSGCILLILAGTLPAMVQAGDCADLARLPPKALTACLDTIPYLQRGRSLKLGDDTEGWASNDGALHITGELPASGALPGDPNSEYNRQVRKGWIAAPAGVQMDIITSQAKSMQELRALSAGNTQPSSPLSPTAPARAPDIR